MKTSEILFVGEKAQVAAINKHDGKLLWKTKLAGWLRVAASDFVAVLVEQNAVYAYTCGSIHCLNPANGEKVWKCEDVGLGHGHAMLAAVGQSTQPTATAAEELEQAAASNAAAVSAASAGG